MSTNVLKGVAGLLVLAAGSVASANLPKTFTGQGGAIPDNLPNSPLRREIVIPPDGSGPIKSVQLALNMTHSWVGDIKVVLTHKDTGHSVVVFDRPGVPTLNGTPSTVGSGANLAGTYTFGDAFAASFETASNGPPVPTTVAPGNYHPENSLDAFAADGFKFGTWSIEVSDSAGLDTGTLNSWTLTVFNAVPTPGAAALFGLAGLAGLRRRR